MDRERLDKDLDRWLDAALADYGKAEPPEGIEARVLANLRAHAGRRLWWRRWLPVGAVAALTLALAIWTFLPREHSRSHSPSTPLEAGSNPVARAPEIAVAGPSLPPAEAKATLPRKPRPLTASERSAAEPLPRLPVFPSAAPQSDEKRLLLNLAHALSNGNVTMEPAGLELQPIEIPKIDIPAIRIQAFPGDPGHRQK